MKRFTDTEKWKGWFRKLKPELKLLWIYICDACDNAGVWEVDHELAEMCIGKKVNWTEALKELDNRILIFKDGEKWFIKKFIKFQYGELTEKCIPHRKVFSLLETHNIDYCRVEPTLQGRVGYPLLEEEEDKDKEKDKEEEEEKDKEEEEEKDKRKTTNVSNKDIQEVLDYLNEKTGCKYRRTDEIKARLKEGGTVQECKQIIDNKLLDPFFQEKPQFLKPTTLFAKSHWDDYLNYIPPIPKKTIQEESTDNLKEWYYEHADEDKEVLI